MPWNEVGRMPTLVAEIVADSSGLAVGAGRGELGFALDTERVWIHDGSVWHVTRAHVQVVADEAALPAGTIGDVAFATDHRRLYVHDGANWLGAGVTWGDIAGKP